MPNSPMHYIFSGSQDQFIRGNRNRNRNAAREWNGMECPPQVPPYEPSKNHVEITPPKGHEIQEQSQETQRNKGPALG